VEVGRAYLELALRLRRIAPALVEDYTGPPELAAAIDAERPVAAPELAEQADGLRAQVHADEQIEPDRRAWLSAQLAGIATALRWFDGLAFGYRELVERCHGVRAQLASEERFEEAHGILDRVLPGSGDVRERYQRWTATQLVPRELLADGLSALADELGRRSRVMFDLPDGEEVSFVLVGGTVYAANAGYQGELRTRVAINAELPISSSRLLELVSHEAYPGHHAEQACKASTLIARRGRVELAAYVYPTPQALLAEGIACHALEALLGEEAEDVAARCLRPLGIPYDPATAAVVREAEQLLLWVRPNIAIMLDEARLTSTEARAYARRWMPHDDEQVERSIEGLQRRVWRPYESCYPAGLELCRRFTRGDPARFRRLLHEQLTPAALTAQDRP
jgi:hypothetical protein